MKRRGNKYTYVALLAAGILAALCLPKSVLVCILAALLLWSCFSHGKR